MKPSDNPWQTITSKLVYQNPWMKVYEDQVRLPNGNEGIYGFIEGKPGVFIIALNEDGHVHLIESFRYPTQAWQWELPTGGVDKGHTPLEAAKQELAEELGMRAELWTPVNTFGPSSNAYMKDTEHVFIAEKLSPTKEKPEDFEAIRATKAVSIPELLAMIQRRELADGQSLAALMQFVAQRGKL